MTSWREIRQEVLRRDNRQCQVCGKKHSGQVHHVIPRSQGGSNELSNLITLCGRCHMLISGSGIDYCARACLRCTC